MWGICGLPATFAGTSVVTSAIAVPWWMSRFFIFFKTLYIRLVANSIYIRLVANSIYTIFFLNYNACIIVELAANYRDSRHNMYLFESFFWFGMFFKKKINMYAFFINKIVAFSLYSCQNFNSVNCIFVNFIYCGCPPECPWGCLSLCNGMSLWHGIAVGGLYDEA